MKKNIIFILILVLLVGIFFWKFFVFGHLPIASDIISYQYSPWNLYHESTIVKNPLLSDPVTIFYPFTILTYEYLKDFKIPLWNPYLLCGIPHNISFSVPFPVFLSLALISSLPAAYSFIIILQVFLSGFFMFLYLKNLKVASFGSFVGAIVFMLNGVFAVWLEFTTTVGAGLWFPLIFLLIDKTISKRSFFYSGLTALFIGIHFFSSHLQFATYLLISAFVYALFRTIWLYRKENSFNSNFKPMGLIVLSFGLGISLSSAYILPTFDKASFSHRQEVNFDELNPLPVANLVTFVIPDFYGTPAPPHSYMTIRSWFYKTGLVKERVVKVGGENYNEYCGYIGVLPLILALLAGLLRKDRDSRFFFGFWIVSLLLALGTFLYLPLYWFAPGFNKMGISRIIFLFCFSGSILAGMGAEYLTGIRDQGSGFRREGLIIRIIVWVLAIATLGWLIFLLVPKFNLQLTTYNLQLLSWHFSLKNPSMSIPILLVLSSIIILILSLRARKFATKAQRHKESNSRFPPPRWGRVRVGVREGITLPSIPSHQGRGKTGYLVAFVSWCLGGIFSKSLWLKGAILVVVSFDLLYFGMKYNPMTPKEWLFPETPSLNFLTDKLEKEPPFRIVAFDRILPPNTNLVYRLQSVEGYESLHSARYHDFMKELVSPDIYHNWIDIRFQANRRFLQLLNVRYVLADREFRGEDLELVYDGEIKIYEDLKAYPRAWIVPEAKVLKTREEIFAEMKSPEFDPRKMVILEEVESREYRVESIEGRGQRAEPNTEHRTPNTEIVEYQPEKIIIEAYLPQAGFLVLSDSYYPGWRVFVDGSLAKILKANYIMRAVRLSPGHHQVEFIYDPSSFKLGLAISLATLFLIIILMAYALFKGQKT